MNRQSTKGKKCHSRYDGNHKGRFGGNVVVTRLQIGVPKNVDSFLRDISEKTQLTKSEYVRRRLMVSQDYNEWAANNEN